MFLGIERHGGEGIALKDNHDASLTYSQLIEEILRFKSALTSRNLAFCLCRNEVACAVGYLAMVDSGTVPVMLSASLDSELLKQLTREYDPKLLWVPDELVDSFECSVKYSFMNYRLIETNAPTCIMADELELCMSTSGSTGSPKLVRYKKGNLEANARNVAMAFGWTDSERAFADLGLQYTMSLNVLNTHLWVGATVLLCDLNILTSEYWQYLVEEQATNITGVPFTYDILTRLKFTKKHLPHLTTIAEGGGKLADNRFRELAQYAAVNGKRFFATFGTTETAARMSYLPPDKALCKIGSIGIAIPEGELYLIDRYGNRIESAGVEGELCYCGPNVTMGYAESRNDLALGDEWQGTYRTGDLAKRDEDGFYYITGRLSRFLKLLGYRVSLDQCEQMISQEFGVTCACAGSDSAMIVYAERPENPEVFCDFLANKLGIRKSLFLGKVVSSIPRNESGKILYKHLAKLSDIS